MELKKNPDFDLNRNSGLYFEIGLALMLFVSYSLLNYKTYDKPDLTLDMITMNEEEEEDVPLINVMTPPPPPPPKAAPEVITVVEDVVEVEETIIESTETSMEDAIEPIVSIEDVNVDEFEEDISVPFAVVEKIPIWPGCKGKNNAELKKCFQENMIKHVKKNFEYPQTAIELRIRGKVFVLFTIDSNGKVANIKTRGPDKILEREAARIISLLPQMTPGKQRGRSVNVPYSLPIIFKFSAN
jgi:periplasmic protein TonB